jgi:hypothetical protein
MQAPRNRADHFIPQGYLRGFVDPARKKNDKPLWCLSKERNCWERKSTAQICQIHGLYDSGTDSTNVEHPDVTFAQFENRFPPLIAGMKASGFVGWQQHMAFLLHYLDHIRARSPLALRQREEELSQATVATILSVDPDEKSITYDEPRPLTQPEMRDGARGTMRHEIATGPTWMSPLHWQVRLAPDPHNPVVTCDCPVVVDGTAPSLDAALNDASTLICFPLCWEACLVGRTQPFAHDLCLFEQTDLIVLRSRIVRQTDHYVISPQVVPRLVFEGQPPPSIKKKH